MLDIGDDAEPHDFTLEWVEADRDNPAGLHLCSVDCGGAQPDHIPLGFRLELGKLLTAAKMPWLNVGLAYTCDKKRVNSHGGEFVRLYPNGAVVRPNVSWPEASEIPNPQ